MARKTFQILAILALVTLVGCDGQGGTLLSHLHGAGHALHHGGGGHDGDPMAEVIEQLDLTPDQSQRLEKIHEILGSYGSAGHGSMDELHQKLVARFAEGDLEADEIRTIADEHLEQIRTVAYGVSDEMVVLINSLDATQRETLSAHLQESQEGHHGHGP